MSGNKLQITRKDNNNKNINLGERLRKQNMSSAKGINSVNWVSGAKSFLKVKGCYSRFHFHVLDYCKLLRMHDDLYIQECLINKLSY